MTEASKRLLRRVVGIALIAGVAVGICYAALSPPSRRIASLRVKSLIIEAAQLPLKIHDPYGPRRDEPTCNCAGDWPYRCDDVDLPYFERVRADPRLRRILQPGRHDLETYVSYRQFLRSRFPNGAHSRLASEPWKVVGLNLLELLDEVDRGERLLCGRISKMLVQMIQASGGFGRIVALGGHVVAEAWIPDLGKWVMLDADYNVLFTNASGMPLSALEIHRLWLEDRIDEVQAHAGRSPNTLYHGARKARLLSRYGSLGFDPRADWLSAPYPYWHPARHPKTRIWLWDGRVERPVPNRRPAFWAAELTRDEAQLYFEPCRGTRAAAGDITVSSPMR